jgi:hypothetical protein
MLYSLNEKTKAAKKAQIITQAIVELAKHDLPGTFPVPKMIWGVSLYLVTGDFIENWTTYSRISVAARQIRDAAEEGWRSHITFEHARPIKQIYRMLRDRGSNLTIDEAAAIIGQYPPVLITTAENKVINDNGHRSAGSPEERYAHIDMGEVDLRVALPDQITSTCVGPTSVSGTKDSAFSPISD